VLTSSLELAVVAHVQLEDARRVAAAAEVFQQDRVVQLAQLGRRQTGFAADVQADPAGTHAMSLGLPLGDVERVAERAHQFGQAQGGAADCGQGR